jgi:hypothetical protein
MALVPLAGPARHSKPQSQYGIRVNFCPSDLDLAQLATVLVTLGRAVAPRRPVAILDRHCALAGRVRVGMRG